MRKHLGASGTTLDPPRCHESCGNGRSTPLLTSSALSIYAASCPISPLRNEWHPAGI